MGVSFLSQLFQILFFVAASSTPFRVGVVFDNTEMTADQVAAMADMNEQSEAPGGIVGFMLNYWQRAC